MNAGLGRLMNRRNAIALFVLALAASCFQLRHVSIDRGYEKILPAGDQSAADYEFVRKSFRNDEAAIVIAEGPNLWTPEVLNALKRLSHSLQAIEGVDRVTGITTARYITGSKEDVTVHNFLPYGSDYDGNLRSKAVNYPPYRGWLVNEDGMALVHYVVAKNGADPTLIYEGVEDVLREFRGTFAAKGIKLFQSGTLHASAELSRATQKSSKLLVATIGIMLVVAWILTKCLKAAVLAAFTGTFAIVFTFSLMGFVGVALNPVNVLVPNILLPLGTAFGIHAYGYAVRGGERAFGWLPRNAVRPFLFATLSTMIGFGATAISSIPAVRQFGIFGCFGILACAFVTFFLTFPLLGTRAHTPEKRRAASLPKLAPSGLATFAALLIAALSLMGIRKISIDYSPIDYFPPSAEVRRQFDRTSELLGAYLFFLTIRGENKDDAIQPERLRVLWSLRKRLENHFPGVRVSSINDPLSVMHKAFTADEEDAEELPDSKRLAAQYLLLYTGDTDTYLDRNRSNINAIVLTPFRSAGSFRKLEADVKSFARENNLDVILSGRIAQFFRAAYEIAWDQIYSVSLGVGLVMALFAIFFGSLRLALIAIIPNVLPIAACFALLGWLGINLDIGTSIAGAIALGIVVDDTAHFLMNYKLRRRNHPPSIAARLTIAELRTPIITTSVCVIAGFLALLAAELLPFRTLGGLLAAIILTALFGDIMLLPVLLAQYDKAAVPATEEEVKEAKRKAKLVPQFIRFLW